MSAAGTYARVPMGEAFDVMCNELDDIVNRMCGIEEVALAYAWLQNVRAGLGGEGAVAQAGGSGSAATNGEPERAPSPPSLVGEPPPASTGGTGGSPTRHLAAVPKPIADRLMMSPNEIAARIAAGERFYS